MLEYFCYKNIESCIDSKKCGQRCLEQEQQENYLDYYKLKGSYIHLILHILISILAFSLSWDCNTARGMALIPKLFYAIFAFLFGGLYILFYIIFNYGTCK